MHITIRFIAPLLISLLAFATPISAQSWQYNDVLSENRVHAISYQNFATIYYNPTNQTWFLSIGLHGVTRLGTPALKFTYSDGSGPTYSLNRDMVEFDPLVGQDFARVNFSISQEGLDLFQSANTISFINDKANYTIPLTGSRAAVVQALGYIENDKAVEADRKRAAQAKDDARQSLNKCDSLTAHEWDKNRETPGVTWAELDSKAAISACTAARKHYGDQGRIIYQLGRAYDKAENPVALKLMRLAAWELEYPAAFYHLGTLHQDGLYTPKNLQKARRAFLEGWSYENVPSSFALGKMDYKAAKTDGEQKAALDKLFKSANKLYPFALDYVGTILFNGEIAGGSPSSAVTYLREASKRDQANSSYLLYTMYRDGNGVDADRSEAQSYLVTAARQGHTQAKKDLDNQ